PSAFSMDREAAFLTGFRALRRRFPRLRIVLEHVSTADGILAVLEAGPRTAATITAHHLTYTFDDLAGGSLKPHLFCKPLLKRPSDRQALREAAFSGNPAFFFGSDSAPHVRTDKESALCSAGCYTMPVSLPMLADLFDNAGRLERLEPFVSHFGADFYGLPRNKRKIVLERRPWVVPESYHGVVTPNAGQTVAWQRTS
ncbi:MAG: dihydroorotase, partial [Spirochaetales bacterium]|nr:dihydroorotase [Spirochaetales bacterium]